MFGVFGLLETSQHQIKYGIPHLLKLINNDKLLINVKNYNNNDK